MWNRIISNKHAQSLFEKVGTSGLAIISFIILARVFSQNDFGQWILYLTLLTFVDMIKCGVVKTALIKYASGSKQDYQHELIGSSWILNLILVSIITIGCYSIYYLDIFQLEGIIFFLLFYPIYAIVSMPFFYFLWNNQAFLEFKKITLLRIFNALVFLMVCLLSLFISINLQQLIIMHLLIFSISSILALYLGNTGCLYLIKATKSTCYKIIRFAQFHMLAFLGSNLLKSADVFLIGAFLGPVAIAIYSIPLRLIEVIEAPLKSAVAVAFPVISSHDNNNNKSALKDSIEKYIGILTLLYIPFMTILYLLSEPLVLLIGGDKYLDAVYIFQLFLIYGLFLPFDRLTGITLDAIGLPKLNFYKVVIMASINIIGDILVIYFFKSLELVALVTVMNVISGMIIGYLFVKREINLSIKSIIKSGFSTILNYYKKYTFNNELT